MAHYLWISVILSLIVVSAQAKPVSDRGLAAEENLLKLLLRAAKPAPKVQQRATGSIYGVTSEQQCHELVAGIVADIESATITYDADTSECYFSIPPPVMNHPGVSAQAKPVSDRGLAGKENLLKLLLRAAKPAPKVQKRAIGMIDGVASEQECHELMAGIEGATITYDADTLECKFSTPPPVMYPEISAQAKPVSDRGLAEEENLLKLLLRAAKPAPKVQKRMVEMIDGVASEQQCHEMVAGMVADIEVVTITYDADTLECKFSIPPPVMYPEVMRKFLRTYHKSG